MNSSFLYCSHPVMSAIPIPELPPSQGSGEGIFFCLESAREQDTDAVWTQQWRASAGQVTLAHRREGETHWLRFPALADFRISADAGDIACYPLPGIAEETIRHLLLDQVLPRCLAQQGRLMLHASAVRLDEGVLLFIGSSGAGKSTLAGNFHQAGHTALSDDCVWLKESGSRPTALPTYGGLRLWEDSLHSILDEDQPIHPMAHYSSKKRVFLTDQATGAAREGYPVRAVIAICPAGETPGADVSLEPLSRREAYMELVKQTFWLNVNDWERITGLTEALGGLIPALRTLRLRMRRAYRILPKVRAAILEAVKR